MKIGILTHYFKNINYGGALQAYALCKVLNKLGYNAEQICYDYSNQSIAVQIDVWKKRTLKGKISTILTLVPRKISAKKNQSKYKDLYDKLALRRKSFDNFTNRTTPHSEKVYVDENISESVDLYDAFITGSDQVFNPDWYYPAMYLNFAPKEKIKLSYAASIGKNNLTNSQSNEMKKQLSTFTAVSVREENAVSLMQNIGIKDAVRTLDPTLLMDKNEWDMVCSERVVAEKYLFCFFLGESKKQRNLATKYAVKHGLKIVTLPYLLGSYNDCDGDFGDYQLYDISPEKFISLIKYAEYVITDSFHATVFSHIYNKQYAVCSRSHSKSMGSRIYTLLSMIDSTERFLDESDKECIEYIEKLKDIDYSKSFTKLNEMKNFSLDFLTDNLSR